AVVVSALAGIATVAFVLRARYGWARVSAATAVAAIVAGWGLAQRPQLLPGLTIDQAAAGRSTLVALLAALAIGAVILVPSLALLFSLLLRGRFDEGAEEVPGTFEGARHKLPLVPAALACLTIGAASTVVVDSAWGRIVGVPFLFAFIVLGFF